VTTVHDSARVWQAEEFDAHTRHASAIALWVQGAALLGLAGLFWLALQQTSGRLTIVTVLYFLGSAALFLLVVRLWTGHLGEFAIWLGSRPLSTGDERHQQRPK
jgi:hypothetical protein